jgi:hypothetical protein
MKAVVEPEEKRPEELEAVKVDVPGCPPVIFAVTDFSCREAWECFLAGKPLDPDAFMETEAGQDQWKRYFFLSIGLTEGVVMVYGAEGSGKSLFASYLAYQYKRLFLKPCTLDWYPLPGFGPYDHIDVENLPEEFEKIAKLAKDEDKITDDQLAELCKNLKLYNRVFGIDEAYEKVDKSRRTNISIAYGRLNRLWRHFHNLMIYISPDEDDFDRRMVWKRRTHTVSCGKDTIYEDTCSYTIKQRRTGLVRQMHLKPENWLHLWKSHNLRGITQTFKMKI